MGQLFGTDGVRGIANTELTCDLAFKLGQAAVVFLGKTLVVGKDTRLSGDMLESALAAGVMSMGGTVLLAGVIPTPGVAFLTRELHGDGGIVISASHNPPEYNGIKLFDARGFKLSDALEEKAETFILGGGTPVADLPFGEALGVAIPVEDACGLYIDHVVKSVRDQGIDLEGLHIALDTGHGASALTSKEALRRLGAQVTAINDDFTGLDINVGCGSTCLTPLQELVGEVGADVGIAHDGDADRVMFVGPGGLEIDGDMIEAVCALDMLERGVLKDSLVATTVMCNLGFVHAMRKAGIEVVQTKVGDRYVLEAMLEKGCVLGGEQSGHLIMLDYNSTGDGLLVAAQFLAACKRQGKTVEEAASVMARVPQVLINVKDVDKAALPTNEALKAAVAAAEEEMGSDGRVLIRPSGTEPLVRVMVESLDPEQAARIANRLVEVVKEELQRP
ncbi:MAG: phosphoglucosamine mutase [Eggerthellaceae bacterium]|jgi:phosphoglucosamine mutase|nr:phosphoglucosamine mutase [Eggerthellaceae bacterium]MDR2716119.1 phosphoglucosamine mutase [Coriobacteriaceae bacterium]